MCSCTSILSYHVPYENVFKNKKGKDKYKLFLFIFLQSLYFLEHLKDALALYYNNSGKLLHRLDIFKPSKYCSQTYICT